MARFDLAWLGCACVLALVGCGSDGAPSSAKKSSVPTELPDRDDDDDSSVVNVPPTTPQQPTTPTPTEVKPVIDPNRAYTIEVVSALISLGDGPNGAKTEWDSFALVDPNMAFAVADALEVPQEGAVIAASVTSILASANAPPDPYGSVDLLDSGQTKATMELPRTGDTFAPAWGNQRASFHGVKITDKIRLRVNLMEHDDFGDDDAIGSVDLSFKDFDAALRAGGVHHVRVTSQSDNILFVGLNVLPE